MGVRGLTTYVAANADQYLDSFELHDTNLVIDGDSLSCQLYKSLNSAYGGNYDQFFGIVCSFFGMLKQCNVIPYVLLDGGYKSKKLSTIKQRLRAKIGAIKYLNPVDSGPTFPIMMREVFVESMLHCNVKYMRCIFEADDEVAALSRKLKCPVLSFDSDFFIHNVIYIPSNTLTLKVYRRNIQSVDGKKVRQRRELVKDSGNVKKNNAYYFMECKVYRIENLAREKRLSAEMLPLFAILLGNDFVSTSIFNNFYLNVSLKKTGKKNTKQYKRIVALLRWLKHETLDSAIDKIINHVKKDRKAWLRDQINFGVNGYIAEKSMAYNFFFGPSNKNSAVHSKMILDLMIEETSNIKTEANEHLLNEFENAQLKCSSSSSDNDNEGKDELDVELYQAGKEINTIPPEWLLNKILSAKLPRYIVDLLTLRLYINTPQVENFQLDDCNRISVPILQLIFTALCGKHTKRKEFRYLTRVRCRTDIEYIQYCSMPEFSEEFNTKSSNNYKYFKLILRDFEDSEMIFETINKMVAPDNQLLFIAIVYWSRFSKHFNVIYTTSILLCQIVLTVMESIIEPVHDRNRFEKKFKTHEVSVRLQARAHYNIVDENRNDLASDSTVITRDECILGYSNFLDLFSLQSNKLRPNHTAFSSDIIHGFGEFQSIVFQINCLNVLCGEPYKNINVSKCINGIFLFNTYSLLKDRLNTEYYVKNFLLPVSPNIFNLFDSMFKILSEYIPCLSQKTISGKKKRKNIRKKKSRLQKINLMEENVSDTANRVDDYHESDFEDENNRFSCLSLYIEHN